MLSGNTRFGCLDRLGIVGVVVAHVISRALEFNKLGADLIRNVRGLGYMIAKDA